MSGAESPSQLVEFARLLSSSPDETAFVTAAVPLLRELLGESDLHLDPAEGSAHDGEPAAVILVDGEPAGRVRAADEDTARTAARLVAEGLTRLRREEALREALAESRRTGETKDRFLAAVSHEIRTPLTSIRSFAEILLDHPEEEAETRSEFLSIIHDESVRLTRLVNNLLDLGRIQAGRMNWQFALGSLKETIRTAVRSIASLAADREVMIRMQGEDTLGPLTYDSDKVIQVLVNLLSNAVKYSPRGEPILVICDVLPTGVRVTVRDRGPGIPVEYRKRIFDRFWRMEGGRQPGTGLGLAIALEIAVAHGGRIWVDENLDGGCDFVFEIPDRAAQSIMVAADVSISAD